MLSMIGDSVLLGLDRICRLISTQRKTSTRMKMRQTAATMPEKKNWLSFYTTVPKLDMLIPGYR